MKIMMAAVSAIALAAVPAMAQGNGNGNGNGNRGGGQVERGNNGGGNGNANRGNRGGQAERGDRGNRGNGNANRGNRGNGQADRGNRGGPDVIRGNQNRGNGNADRGNGNANRGNGNVERRVAERVRDVRRDNDRYRDRRDRYEDRRDFDLDRVIYSRSSYVDGCPPGLAKKNPPCVPPGQAKQRGDWDRYDDRYSRYRSDWWGYDYGRGNYFYEDGYLMRYDGNRVSGYIPLLGGALSIGNPWPTNYGYDRVPDYYSSYYGLGNNYRYADNVVYRLDPETAAITSIAALLTGDEFTVGQPMPRGYDVYNVPYSYRDRYYDRPDRMYRYSDGYVYQVDPETRLVAAAIELLI